MRSILANASKNSIVTDPFPYLVIRDAVDEELYNQLAVEYPSDELLTAGKKVVSNARYQINAHESIDNQYITDAWKDFIAYHTSCEFYQEIVELFGEHITSLYPRLEKSMGKKLENFNVGIRFHNQNKEDIILDCQPGINSPVTSPSRVRGPHVDNPVELYAGLLYMRDENDDSTGGDLEIYRYKDSDYVFYGKAELEDKYVEKIATINYEKNVFVLFINSLHSVHGVSIRSLTQHSRRLVNIIGELYNLPEGGLFTLKREEPKNQFFSFFKKR